MCVCVCVCVCVCLSLSLCSRACTHIQTTYNGEREREREREREGGREGGGKGRRRRGGWMDRYRSTRDQSGRQMPAASVSLHRWGGHEAGTDTGLYLYPRPHLW